MFDCLLWPLSVLDASSRSQGLAKLQVGTAHPRSHPDFFVVSILLSQLGVVSGLHFLSDSK